MSKHKKINPILPMNQLGREAASDDVSFIKVPYYSEPIFQDSILDTMDEGEAGFNPTPELGQFDRPVANPAGNAAGHVVPATGTGTGGPDGANRLHQFL